MTKDEFQELLNSWCRSDVLRESGYADIKNSLNFLERVLLHEYEPADVGIHGEFSLRLAKWIGSAENEYDRQSLYLMLKHLFFVGRDDMKSAYLTAYSKNILSWLINIGQISIFAEDAECGLKRQLALTVFTEITESFKLADFNHWNNIHGQTIRYTWEQHLQGWVSGDFSDRVLNGDEKKYLVLLEDFVGSGTQMKQAIHNACSVDFDVDVLLCPIMICPDGAEMALELEERYPRLTYSPVLEIPTKHFIKPACVPGEHEDYARIRQSLNSVHQKVKGTPGSWQQERGPFGWLETGAIFAKYDNCPDNSIPALHHRSDLEWEPLFYRASRE